MPCSKITLLLVLTFFSAHGQATKGLHARVLQQTTTLSSMVS